MTDPNARPDLIARFVAGAALDEVPAYLGPALASACAEGRQAWSEFSIDDQAFCEFLGARFAAEELAPEAEPLRIADLYLACACSLGVAGASEQFVRSCDEAVRTGLARIVDAADRQEVMQQVWENLLVAGAEQPPRIALYKGRGPLHAFVRVAAVRLAITLRRKLRPEAADDSEIQRIADASDDPEIQYLKQLYKTEFRRSFATAFAALPPEHQLLLRLDVVDHLTIDEAAAAYGRSRTTTGRHLLEARQALARATLSDLQTRLSLDDSDVHSVARLVRSQIDISVQRLLAESS
ncbi:MAG: sigma-70 family RNA polymerase sigma factor [Kofleriaceae bacterium]